MDLVTIADVACEKALAARLLDAFPGHRVLGEEAASDRPSLLNVLATDEPVWVLDPIDGTINFAAGREDFAVIVAYCKSGKVIAGWIHNPTKNTMTTAELGAGTWSDHQRLRVLSDTIQMIGSVYDKMSEEILVDAFAKKTGREWKLRNLLCTAVEYDEVVRSKRDFILTSSSLPWDHAAGTLMVEEAGGVARFIDGSRYLLTVVDRHILIATDEVAWHEIKNRLHRSDCLPSDTTSSAVLADV